MSRERGMLSNGRTSIVAAAFLLAVMVSTAQGEQADPKNGLNLNVIGTGLTDKVQNNVGTVSIPRINRFLDLEKIFNPEVSFSDIPEEKVWDDTTRLIVDYYFGSGEITPLVGISMGYVQKENEKKQLLARPKIGLKYYMNPSTYLYGLLEYQLLFDETARLPDVYDDGEFVYGIGLGLTFSY